ncbi:MAG: hypothetical protein ACXW3R_08115 [Rhodoplanes sp.]
MVDPRKLHEIWNEQCEAARTIRDRYGLEAAFDYLVEEKLLNFAEAASEHRAFAQELPRFVSEVRRIFTAEEIAVQLKRIERERNERDAAIRDKDDPLPESPIRRSAGPTTTKAGSKAPRIPHGISWHRPDRLH